MPPAQMLRAIDYIEAVWNADDDAMERLEQHTYGTLPIRHLLADFLHLMAMSATLLGATADAQPQEQQDRAAILAGVLVGSVREWAETARPDVPDAGDDEIPDFRHASVGIARTIASYLLATTTGDPGDLTSRLDALRTAPAAMDGTASGA